jgi:hypothetical protein
VARKEAVSQPAEQVHPSSRPPSFPICRAFPPPAAACNAHVRHKYVALPSLQQRRDMRWLPTPSFLLSTTTSALRFSPPSALRRPSTLVQQQGLLALGLVRPFSLLHHQQQQQQHCPSSTLVCISSLRLRAHSTAASTTTMATREEKDRYVCAFGKEDGDGVFNHSPLVLCGLLSVQGPSKGGVGM